MRPLVTSLVVFVLSSGALGTWGVYAQRQREAAYGRGHLAASERNWEAAARDFLAAGDHLDGPERLKEAEAQLATVASLYTAADAQARGQQWGEAAAALQKALELHPGYRDGEARLADAQSGQERAYDSGQKALEERNLDDALRMLRAAGAWRDAPQRLALAEGQLAVAAALYAQAEADASRQRWWESVQSLRQVVDLYPRYLDAASRLADVRARLGVIVWISRRDGNYEVYLMHADGSNPTRLTDRPGVDESPSLSPDGRWIAFASLREGNEDIYVMGVDGSNQTRLTDDPGADNWPAWSPDGSQIAFYTNRDGNWEIYVMDADGSNPRRLTNHSAEDRRPTWSPDGRQIAFSSRRDGNSQIYVMNADGSNPRRLTTTRPGNNDYPAWSPDGRRIAFASGRDSNWEIYVMNANGSAQSRLTFNPSADHYPTWSPDGRHIAFSSERDGVHQIYFMAADGSGMTRLTDTQTFEGLPRWGPGRP